jgi:hypothetical protein
MIDASLKSYDVNSTSEFGDNVSDYDETAYNHFFIRHSQAVLEANLAGAEPPLDVTPIDQIPDFVDRELRLVVSTPTADKMQLTAYLTYMLDDSILLPSGIDYEFNGLPLFESEMYDLPTAPDDGTKKKLSQIYIMYSKAALEPENIGFNQDIRIMDPAHVMKANIFIAKQQETATQVENVLNKDLGTGRDTTVYNVRVSFRKPQEGTTESYHPAGGDLYCSGNVELQDETSYTATTKLHDNNLVAKGDEVRIITTTLEILKQGTDTVLASKKVTHLQ